MDFLLPMRDTFQNGQEHPQAQNWVFDSQFGLWRLKGSERDGWHGLFTDDPTRKVTVTIIHEEPTFVDTKKITVREISQPIAKEMIVANHYTHAWTLCSVALGVFLSHESKKDSFIEDDNETLIGCVIFGNPIGRSAAASISPMIQANEVLELTRLWISDIPNGKNIESYVIGKCFSWLRENRPEIKALLSYADNEAGHTGVIYQSTNWLYQGNSQLALMPNYSVSLTGADEGYSWIHSRTVMSRWGSHNVEHLKKAIGKTFWRKKESSKHRYVYILSSGHERKKIIKNLKHKTYPYPKSAHFDEVIEEIYVDPNADKGVNNLDAFLT